MAIKGIFVAVALYFGLSWATYSGTVSPKKPGVPGEFGRTMQRSDLTGFY